MNDMLDKALRIYEGNGFDDLDEASKDRLREKMRAAIKAASDRYVEELTFLGRRLTWDPWTNEEGNTLLIVLDNWRSLR